MIGKRGTLRPLLSVGRWWWPHSWATPVEGTLLLYSEEDVDTFRLCSPWDTFGWTVRVTLTISGPKCSWAAPMPHWVSSQCQKKIPNPMTDYFFSSLNLEHRWNLGGDTPCPSGAKEAQGHWASKVSLHICRWANELNTDHYCYRHNRKFVCLGFFFVDSMYVCSKWCTDSLGSFSWCQLKISLKPFLGLHSHLSISYCQPLILRRFFTFCHLFLAQQMKIRNK